MKQFKVGTKLDLLRRHQDTRKFVPAQAIGEVVQGTEGQPHKMKVRVYGENWYPQKGYQHELLRVTDSVWLVRIGIRVNKDGTTNLPAVFEIVAEITDDEFARKRAELFGTVGA